MRSIGEKLLLKKDIETAKGNVQLKKSLHWWDLTFFGVGAIIGAGIFVLTGVAAKQAAGPAVSVSYTIDALACILSGLCYCEFASKVPLTGSAYTYTYTMIGELPAFFVGWALLLEYGFSVSTVARGWGGYLANIISGFGGEYPTVLLSIPLYMFDLDLTACIAVVLISGYLLLGIKQSSIFNTVITGLSVLVIFLVVIYGATFVNTNNWSNFTPYGVSGIFRGAGMVFFAYVGFDMVANFAEEAHNPNKDLPISIISSLLFSSLLYVAVALVVSGMVPYYDLDIKAPLAAAFGSYGVKWAEIVISIGAFAALTTSMLVSLTSSARIIFSMSRDGLIPKFLARVSEKTNEPYLAQIFSGLLCAILTLFLDIGILSELVSIGTLAAFTFVNACVIILRTRSDACQYKDRPIIFILAFTILVGILAVSTRILNNMWITIIIVFLLSVPGGLIIHHFQNFVPPNTESSDVFHTPLVPLIPLLGILVNIYVMCSLDGITWLVFVSWLAVGGLVYFSYGYRNSVEASRIRENEPLFKM